MSDESAEVLSEYADHRDSYPMGNIHHGTEERPDWGTFCVECKQSWPCDVNILTARLAAERAAHAEEVAGLRAERDRAVEALDNYLSDPPLPIGNDVIADAQEVAAMLSDTNRRYADELDRVIDGLAESDEAAESAEAERDEALASANQWAIKAGQLSARCDDLRAKVAGVEALFAGGPDTPCRTTWRREDALWGEEGRTECVEVPMDDLRAALATPPTIQRETEVRP